MNSILTVFTNYTNQVPSPPTGVSALAGDSQAIVSWTAPTYNGGAVITYYTFTSSPGGFTASSLGTPATITGLTNGTAYTFTVVATNSAGNSDSSLESSAVTPFPWINNDVVTTINTNIGVIASGAVVASDGNIYIIGNGGGVTFSNLSFICKITLPYSIVSYLTNTSVAGNKDGIGTNASINRLAKGICADNSGNIYIADNSNHLIRKMNIYTLVLSTLAGGGATRNTQGNSDGIGSNALFKNPYDLCIDISNNLLYITDSGNYRIRKLDLATNTVSTLAGSTSGFVDDVGTNAMFTSPKYISYDRNGNLYVTDSNYIRKIDIATATVTRIAGNGTQGYANGIGTTSIFNVIYNIKIAPDGNLYVCDFQNRSIRKVTPDGVVTTYAGGGATGTTAGSTDGTGTNALFNSPNSICFDATGNMYVGDGVNTTSIAISRIRKIT